MKSSRASSHCQSSGTLPGGRRSAGSSECSSFSAEIAGRDALLLLRVLVDHVSRRRAIVADAARLAERDVLAGDVLQLDRDVLEHVAEPGAVVLAHAADEAAGLAIRAAVVGQARQRRDQPVDEAAPSLPVGQASSAPRSRSSRMTGKWAYSDGPDGRRRDSRIRMATSPAFRSSVSPMYPATA